jgi:hypothetical protein
MLCYMVCYRFSDEGQTYWSVYYAESEEAATRMAERDGLFTNGRKHRWTCPYNRGGMSVEQTAEAYRAEHPEAA